MSVSYLMLAALVFIAAVIIYLGYKHRTYTAAALAVVQTTALIWFSLTKGKSIVSVNDVRIDSLSLIMFLIIGVTGTLIFVYAPNYIKKPEFILPALAMGTAMCGIAASNNLLWMYFFWGVTTLCVYPLVGINKTAEAVKNAFKALSANLLGGLAFVFAIVALGEHFNTVELDALLQYCQIPQHSFQAGIPVALLALAAIIKSALMPVNGWLIGTADAPAPVSALLFSATTVNAGIFLIIKLAPALGFSLGGVMVMLVGGVTFLMASLAAIPQGSLRKTLAYSTAATLGLAAACGGVGTYAAAWAGIFLLIFHAVTKALVILSADAAGDSDGDFEGAPAAAAFMMIGVGGMFLAPFGMLISKWAALAAFVDSRNILLIIFVCFGSAATLFYWTKWLLKAIGGVRAAEADRPVLRRNQWVALGSLGILTVSMCLFLPGISSSVVIPYLDEVYVGGRPLAVSPGDMRLLWAMLALIVMLPLFFFAKTNKRSVTAFSAGVGAPALQEGLEIGKYFGELRMNVIGGVFASVVIAAVLSVIIAVVEV